MSKTTALSIVASTAVALAPLVIAGGLAATQAPPAQACGTPQLNESDCDGPAGTLPSDFQQAAGVGDDLKNLWTDNQWKPDQPGDSINGTPGAPTNRTDPQYDCQYTFACW